MAEAAIVEERSIVPARYYCHMCNTEINIPNAEYTCPLCAGGFVEELPPITHLTGGSATGSSSTNAAESGERIGGLNRLSNLNVLRDEIATLLLSRNGPNLEISIDPDHLTRRMPSSMSIALGGTGVDLGNSSAGGSSTSSNTGGGRVRPQNLDRLDNVLFDFLQSLSGVDVETMYGNSEIFFGNLGDYAWGREGIDTIVTQLLNQMETSGPPPLAKEKIAEIPKIEISHNEVGRKLQCSVCWEDFRLQEFVRKLPCSHIYHEDCIVPWLDLHGTCPICRKSLAEENGGENENTNIDAETTVCPVHRNSSHEISESNQRTGDATDNHLSPREVATSQTSQQRHRNIFGFDDGNVDLD